MKIKLAASVATLSLALTSACGGGSGSDAGEDITIGLLSGMTGPLAQPSKEMQQGIELAVEQADADDRFKGRDIKLVVEDDQGEPSVALRKAQKLATQDGATSVIGVASSAVAVALAPQLDDLGLVGMVVGAKTDALTGPDREDQLFRVARSDSQDIEAIKQWIAEEPDLKKWSVIGADYNWGRDNAAAAIGALKDAGRSIVTEEYVATGTSDFGPQINKISAAKPDAVWVALSGQDAIAFLQQAADFGLSPKVPLAGVLLLSDTFVKSAGNAAVGAVGNVQYDVNLDNPENKKFVEAYTKKYDEAPTNYAFDGYLGMTMLLDAYAESGKSDPKSLVDALEGATAETAIGKVELDAETHQLQATRFIGRVEAGPKVTVFQTIPFGS